MTDNKPGAGVIAFAIGYVGLLAFVAIVFHPGWMVAVIFASAFIGAGVGGHDVEHDYD